MLGEPSDPAALPRDAPAGSAPRTGTAAALPGSGPGTGRARCPPGPRRTPRAAPVAAEPLREGKGGRHGNAAKPGERLLPGKGAVSSSDTVSTEWGGPGGRGHSEPLPTAPQMGTARAPLQPEGCPAQERGWGAAVRMMRMECSETQPWLGTHEVKPLNQAGNRELMAPSLAGNDEVMPPSPAGPWAQPQLQIVLSRAFLMGTARLWAMSSCP